MATNEGDVDINFGEDVVTLQCTIRAAKEVNALFGDYLSAARRLETLDLSATLAIVSAGLNKPVKEIEAGVFKTGHANLVKPLSEFVMRLANGGRLPTAPGTEGAAPGEG